MTAPTVCTPRPAIRLHARPRHEQSQHQTGNHGASARVPCKGPRPQPVCTLIMMVLERPVGSQACFIACGIIADFHSCLQRHLEPPDNPNPATMPHARADTHPHIHILQATYLINYQLPCISMQPVSTTVSPAVLPLFRTEASSCTVGHRRNHAHALPSPSPPTSSQRTVPRGPCNIATCRTSQAQPAQHNAQEHMFPVAPTSWTPPPNTS